MERIKAYFKNLYEIACKPEVRILPGNIAYFMVLSLMPLLTVAGIICAKVSLSTTEMISIFDKILPQAVLDSLGPFLNTTPSNSHLIIFMIIGLGVASGGAHAMIISSNELYNINNSSYIVRRIKALFLTIILILLFVNSIIFLAFGNKIVAFILNLNFLSNVSNTLYNIFVWIKWPLSFITIFIMIKLLYTMAPDKKISSKYVNRGALFTTFSWLLVTALYSFYTNNIADYSRLYGSLSSIAILMIWIYILSYIFVVGIAINTSYYKLDDEDIKK